jgi:hypothetical protein
MLVQLPKLAVDNTAAQGGFDEFLLPGGRHEGRSLGNLQPKAVRVARTGPANAGVLQQPIP